MDEGRSGPVRTHARAILAHADARLVALCDLDRARVDEAGNAWGVASRFVSFDELLRSRRFDVVSLATATASREAPIRAIVAAGTPALLCEKPLAESWQEALAVAALLRGSDTRTIVNFWRRFDPWLGPKLGELRQGSLGSLVRGVVTYGKGFNNNGSHAIDLLQAVAGNVTQVTTRRAIDDGRDADPTFDVDLQIDDATVGFVATDHRRYSVFEIDLLFERGRLRLADGLGRLFTPRADAVFSGYTSLACTEERPLDPGAAFVAAARQALDLSRDPLVLPTASVADALRALAVVEAARRSFREQTPVVPETIP